MMGGVEERSIVTRGEGVDAVMTDDLLRRTGQ